MSTNSPSSSSERFEQAALLRFQLAQMELEGEVLRFIKPIIDNPELYLPDIDGSGKKRQNDFSLLPIYDFFGIPVSFVSRRTPEYKAQVAIIRDMIRLVLRKEKLDAVYGYANAEDNDTISIKTSEVEIITFEPNDKGNKGTNEKLRGVRGVVDRLVTSV